MIKTSANQTSGAPQKVSGRGHSKKSSAKGFSKKLASRQSRRYSKSACRCRDFAEKELSLPNGKGKAKGFSGFIW